MSSPENLLELCLSPDLGGLELYMMRCAKALQGDFNVISVITPDGKLEQYYERTEHRYSMLKKSSNLFMFSAAWQLAKIIDAENIDIIHLHWTKDIPIAVLAKKLSKRAPKLAQTRNMTMTRFKEDFYHRLLYKNIDLMLPVTQQVAEQLHRFIPEDIRPRVEVLYMGTDAAEMLSEPQLHRFKKQEKMDAGFIVGMVGRIEAHKGQHLLIEALAELDESVEAYIVGHAMQEGYIDTLKAQAEALGVGERVHFLGFMKNPMHFMQACDTMVLATPCETFGLVVIEAMSVETPMITVNACGPLEIIDAEKDGLFFEKNSHKDLADKIALLSQDTTLHQKLAQNARAKTEARFNNDKQFKKLSKILAEL